MRVNTLRHVDAALEVPLQILSDRHLQVLLFPLYQLPLAVDLQGDAVPLIAWHFVQAVAVAVHVQLVERSLLLLVQLSEDVVTAVLPVDNGVALLPARHRQSKPFRNWSLSNCHCDRFVVLQLQPERQLRRQLVAILLEADVVHGALTGQHGLEVLEQNGIVDGRIVEVVHHEWQSQRPQQLILNASDGLFQLEVAQQFASLEHGLTHRSK